MTSARADGSPDSDREAKKPSTAANARSANPNTNANTGADRGSKASTKADGNNSANAGADICSDASTSADTHNATGGNIVADAESVTALVPTTRPAEATPGTAQTTAARTTQTQKAATRPTESAHVQTSAAPSTTRQSCAAHEARIHLKCAFLGGGNTRTVSKIPRNNPAGA